MNKIKASILLLCMTFNLWGYYKLRCPQENLILNRIARRYQHVSYTIEEQKDMISYIFLTRTDKRKLARFLMHYDKNMIINRDFIKEVKGTIPSHSKVIVLILYDFAALQSLVTIEYLTNVLQLHYVMK